jgi:dsDNA-binding SOS-regulon protein
MHTGDEMLNTIRAELKSLDKAMDTAGELATSLTQLSRTLEGEQKEKAARLADATDNLADELLGISLNLQRLLWVLCRSARRQPESKRFFI